jgi:hypothetical protein
MENQVSKGQRLRRRLTQLSIKPLNVLRTFSPSATKLVVTFSPNDVEGDDPGPSPLPLKQVDTSLDAVFLERLATVIQAQSQPKIALTTVAKLRGMHSL